MKIAPLAFASLLGFSLLSALPAGASDAANPVTRCGWIVNPTPGNWWLTDSQGDWTLAMQGSDNEALGMENMPDLSVGEFVQTNGYYGYACGCMKVEDDADAKRIVAIYSVKQLPLSKCSNDKNLPKIDQ